MSDPEKTPRYGHRPGHRIFHWVIRCFGVGPAYAVLVPVIAYYAFLRPSAIRAAAPYLRRRFPDRGRFARRRLTYHYYYQFGLALVDQAAAGILGPDRLRIDFPDDPEMRRLDAEGRGLVFITSHVGVWQRAISVMEFMRRPVYLHLRREAASESMGLTGFEGASLHIVSPDDFLGGVPELSSALAHGNMVAVMGDRGFGSAACAKVGFLGEEAPFPLLPFHLALTTESDLVVFLTSRTGRMRFRLRAHILRLGPEWREMDRREARIRLLRRYVGLLEEHLRDYPFSWFNFFDFWAGE
jgi:predicted LPLAT superfamily acyltransferase